MKWVRDKAGWALILDGLYVGHVQHFDEGGPFYGTWEVNGGGRTGPMGDAEECKRRVEAKVRPQ